MCAQAIQAHIRQPSEIIVGLPEEKVEEILTLAAEQAKDLRWQPRLVVEAQYRALLDALYPSHLWPRLVIFYDGEKPWLDWNL